MLIYRYRTGVTGRSVRILKLLRDRLPSPPSVSANRKCQSGILPQRSATLRKMTYSSFIDLIIHFCQLGVFKKSNDQFSPAGAPKYPILSAFWWNFRTFLFRLWGVVRSSLVHHNFHHVIQSELSTQNIHPCLCVYLC